jgi:N-acetylneuraminic acid mutarotase
MEMKQYYTNNKIAPKRFSLIKRFFFVIAIGLTHGLIAQPNANEWVWVGGDSANLDKELFGIFGTRGVESPANYPGARNRNLSWTDASDNFWMMGGNGYDELGNTGLLNDLWKFNTTGNQWTWVSGSNTFNQLSVYGTRGVAAASNVPGARQASVSWTDAAGNLWLFGGQGYAATTTIGLLNDLWKFDTLTNQWTWVSGSNLLNQNGVYGTKGVAAAANTPGARQGSVSWTDAAGNLWLMGGENASGRFNDLWKFSTSTSQWTWVGGANILNQISAHGTKGVASVSNQPGARHSSSAWSDASGNLWLFGGSGLASTTSVGLLNDLWKYEIATDQWTWVSGFNIINQAGVYGTKGVSDAANTPGSRLGSFFWKDASGNLYVSAGIGTAGRFNDLWRFNPTVSQWTWLSGSNTINQPGVYGTKGVSSPTNIPGSREYGGEWADASGNLYLWGGSGLNSLSTVANLCDLWKYNLTTNEWTWVGGSNAVFQLGVYGTRGVAATTNKPGARRSALSWTDASGNFWLMGGLGFAETGSVGYLNDLWRYNSSTGLWTWVSGSNSTAQAGVYGTRGVPAAANIPGARQSSVTWIDAQGNLWLMGGFNGSVSFNDLWRYNTSSGLWTWISGSNGGNQNGVYGTRGVAAATNIPGARQASISWLDENGNFWLMGGFGRTATGATGLLNDLWRYNPTTNQWTWISGSTVINQSGFYGVRGVPGAGQPGARQDAVRYTDRSGNIWLIGGLGIDESGSQGLLNDLWKFDVASSLWTWVKGVGTINTNGVYGVKGTPSDLNNPGSRQNAVGWTDGIGNFWLFGGTGLGASGTTSDFLNDLWKYNQLTNQWVWMGGENNSFPSYNYGNRGTASPLNLPPARNTSVAWVDANSNLWMMGGFSRYNNRSNFIYSNDLWRYNINCEVISDFTINSAIQCLTGNNFVFTNKTAATGGIQSLQWNFGNGASSTQQNPNYSYSAAGIYNVQLAVFGNGCSDSLQKTVAVDFPSAIITPQGPTSFCNGSSVVLSAGSATGVTYQWKNNGNDIANAVNSTYQATTSGLYTVAVTNTALNCTATSQALQVTVKPIPPKPTITVNGVDLVSSSTSGNQWYLDGNAVAGATAQTYRPILSGVYTVRLTLDGCTGDFSEPVSYFITSVNNFNNGEFIRIAPNPVANRLIVNWQLQTNERLTARVFNSQGQVMMQFANIQNGQPLNVQHLSQGVYWLQLETVANKRRFVYKIFKVN